MITNPIVGGRVQFINSNYLPWIGRTGRITYIDRNIIFVLFDVDRRAPKLCEPFELEYLELTPEEQDKQKREEHARKFL